MEDKEFQFSRDESGGASGCGACPLARIPAEVWKDLLRRPFRRRHPVLFWGLFLVLAFCLGAGAVSFGGDDDEDLAGDEPALGLITVQGPILDITEKLEWLSRLEQDERIAGVLLRVDSPGGGAGASQELYSALRRLAARKPLAVSMGSTAASGGLMISMAGQRVFAGASTVTGSIGVRMDLPQLHRLMDRLGIGAETLTTAPYKAAGSPLRPLTDEERAYLGEVLRDMHDQFVDIVAEGRHMPREKAAELATGRIFTGRDALAKGLVDELGGFDEAKAWLAEKAGVSPDRELVRMPRKGPWLQRQLRDSVSGLAESAREAAADMAPAFLFQY